MENLTAYYFDIVKPDFYLDISKEQFIIKKRVLISSLCPNQKEVNPSVIKDKMKGKNITIPYVLFYKSFSILIDGHHTTIAKKLNGQKYINALTLNITS